MAKSHTSEDRMEGVCDIFASLLSFLLSCFALLLSLLLSCWQQIASPRGRGVPGNSGGWNDIDDALAARPSAPDDLISPNIDPEGQYNVRLVDQLPAIQDPLDNIDADNAAADESDLNMWLAVAEVASLPQQIERDEANTMVRRPRVSSSVAESGVAPSSLVNDVAAGAPQHPPPQVPVPETVAAEARVPDVVGILAGVLPQQIEDEDEAHAVAEMEVAMETFPPGMLQLISDVASLPQFATASMALPAGDLNPNLEECMSMRVPDVVGILAGVLPQQIEDEDEAHAVAEMEVAMETFPPGMLQMISDVASLPQFATASMALPAGDLDPNLEECMRMPVDHPEAGDSSVETQKTFVRPLVSSSVAESGVAPSSLVNDVAAGAPHHLPPQSPVPETVAANARAPDVGGILAGGLLQQIEDEVEAQAQAQGVAIEAFPPGMLELISDVAKLPQFATGSMSGPAGGLESNLEERMPVDHPEAGDLQEKINMEDDVENLGVEETHTEGMQ